MSKALPTVSENNLLIWDAAKNKCGGYLQKKASQTSAFSKGKWQKRYFRINLEVGPKDNYQLEYFHSPDDKTPRTIMEMSGATVKISSGTAFVINFPDGNFISLNAESSEVMQQWIGTLEHVISVANLRDRMIHQFAYRDEHEEREGDRDEEINDNHGDTIKGLSGSRSLGRLGGGRTNYTKVSGKGWPTVRLDYDASFIPPTSKERHRFIATFSRDVAEALAIDPNMIEVISIKSAPGMDWLSLVEFDLNLNLRGEDYSGENDSVSLSLPNQENSNNKLQYQKKIEARKKLLRNLYEMIRDTSSLLYNGSLTSKIDPSFAINFIDKPVTYSSSSALASTKGGKSVNEKKVDQSSTIQPIEEIFSERIEIMRIMQAYQDVVVPEDFSDPTHFTITLYFEGRIGQVSVPNPSVLAKRYCALWPFEVKEALGFLGTMQELWVDPVELIPRDIATKVAPIPFTPSVRFGGQLCLNAVHLIPDGAYDVKCIDKRDEALNSLSQEEMDSIKETFQQCDLDGDGGISKAEMEEIVRRRTQERKVAILQKFSSYIRENQQDLSSEDIEYFEGLKTQYLQQLQESQINLLRMFEAADLNNDGSISFTEFILAEAWWLRCTINPDRVHLF